MSKEFSEKNIVFEQNKYSKFTSQSQKKKTKNISVYMKEE